MAIDKNTIIKEAQKYAAKGQFDKAIAEWKKLLKETPNDPNIYNTIGDLCLKKDSKAEAVEAYHKAANLLAADGFTSKAIALYKKILNIDNDQIEVHLALGDMNVEKGLIGNALENYKFVADYYTHNKETAKALTIYQKMADLNDSNVAFRVKLGDMYAKEGMKEEGARAYLAAADVHLSKSAFKDARHLFEKVLALDPGNKEVYFKAGIVYFKEEKFVEACKALKHAFEGDPSNKDILDSYLEALDKAGKDVEAEQVLRKLLVEDPSKDDLRKKLYNLYLSKKDFDKAYIEAETLADGKIASGNAGEAEEIYKTFVAGSPYFAPIRQKLAEFYISVDRPQDAAAELMQAAELFVTEGDLQSARTVLTQAIEIAPGMSEARARLEQLRPAVTVEPPSEPAITTAEEPAAIISSPVAPEPPGPPVLESPAPTPPIAEANVSAEEDPAITEAFTEADVLIKYGLADKAVAQLETLSSNFPENLRLRIRLRELYHELGNIDKAVQHALVAVELLTKSGREDQAAAALQEAFEMAPDHRAVLSRLGRVPVDDQEKPAIEVREEIPQPEIIADLPETPLTEIETAPPPLEKIPQPEEIVPDLPETPLTETETAPPFLEEIPQPEEIIPDLPETPLTETETAPPFLEEIPQPEDVIPDLPETLLSETEIAPASLEEKRLEINPLQEPDRQGEREFEISEKDIIASEPEEPMGKEPEKVEPSVIIPDLLEAPLAETDPAPAPFDEIPAEAVTIQEPIQTGEIEFEGLDSGMPPLEETASVETVLDSEPTAIEQQPVDKEVPFVEVLSVDDSPAIVQQSVHEEPPIVEILSVDDSPAIAQQPVEEDSHSGEIPSVPETPAVLTQPVDEGIAPSVDEPTEEEPPIEKAVTSELEQAVIAPAKEAAALEPPPRIDIGEIWAEAEFYFQQGLFDEAKKHYIQIVDLTPGNQRAHDRLAEISREENETREFAKLTDAVEGLEGYLPPEATEGVLATSASDDEAVRALMQEIQRLKQQPSPPPLPPKEITIVAPPPQVADNALSRPVEPVNKADEEDFFDLGAELQREAASAKQGEAASEEFFDLAAELRDEMGPAPNPARPAVPEEEQSLDDIFEEFKKGVEQQSVKEDTDAHYNLGVAYKEMGLLDDAIGEFRMTPENEPKFVQSRYMLGLCYMEKGEYENAISQMQNALDYAKSLGFDTDNRIDMHYDLGLACQCAGNISSAVEEFQKVVDHDPGYRDTAAKLKELQKGDYISLEQLKDDIEKEISSKFLEEGVRIEREEKTRKNERVGK